MVATIPPHGGQESLKTLEKLPQRFLVRFGVHDETTMVVIQTTRKHDSQPGMTSEHLAPNGISETERNRGRLGRLQTVHIEQQRSKLVDRREHRH